jgi:endonuclease YncB( thermonuclease family)
MLGSFGIHELMSNCLFYSVVIVALTVAGAERARADASKPPREPNLDFPSDQVHKPRPVQQTTPMRVEVLTATSFRDIATNASYRLYGVDACELSQTAVLTRQVWPCGVVATSWLVTATLNKWVACTAIRQDGDTYVARCATGEYPDMAAEMLKQGLVVTLPGPADRAIKTYATIEAAAKAAYKGVWGSQFVMPWAYRANPSAAPAVQNFPPDPKE